ncbi:hypothetical protein NITGR_220021 [Nitrospina gracilis 3/211]|uniref:Uncharacterized protein n=1 Tax=Nitrospina gracilis (strain 3/211) TaxID=1266370 RepID=M1YHU0_NITG3|nr:hypothetical protein NITGR_220021 [Nitrospina gracilis 3/211]
MTRSKMGNTLWADDGRRARSKSKPFLPHVVGAVVARANWLMLKCHGDDPPARSEYKPFAPALSRGVWPVANWVMLCWGDDGRWARIPC